MSGALAVPSGYIWREQRTCVRTRWRCGSGPMEAASLRARRGSQSRSSMARPMCATATGDWQETGSLTTGIAPQGDFMAYLSAVRGVQAHAPETHAGIRLTRYSFTVDGPAFAAFVRDQ